MIRYFNPSPFAASIYKYIHVRWYIFQSKSLCCPKNACVQMIINVIQAPLLPHEHLLYIRIHTYIYIYTYNVHMYIYTYSYPSPSYIYIYIYIFISKPLCCPQITCIGTFTHVHACTWVCVCVCVCTPPALPGIQALLLPHKHQYTYIYTYTYIHIWICIYMCVFVFVNHDRKHSAAPRTPAYVHM